MKQRSENIRNKWQRKQQRSVSICRWKDNDILLTLKCSAGGSSVEMCRGSICSLSCSAGSAGYSAYAELLLTRLRSDSPNIANYLRFVIFVLKYPSDLPLETNELSEFETENLRF